VALEAKFKDARMDHLDGLAMEYGAWRLNLRASNTEPVRRLTQELKKKEVLKIMAEADLSMPVLL
jgi:phosphomannomutase